MHLVQQVRSRPGALAAAAGLALLLAACQGPDQFYRGAGQAGNAAPGSAGSIVGGTAGNGAGGTGGSAVTGAAGSIVSGAAGSAAPGAGGSGMAGTPGAAGAMGAGGRGGTTGGGGAGRGGAGGRGGGGGSAGVGGATGIAGAGGRGGGGGGAGRGGTTGTGGAGGRAGAGGTTGVGGAVGAAGAGGSTTGSCPAGGRLDCSATGALKLPADGQVVDFSTGQWNATTNRWCDSHGLDGTLFAFAGTPSTGAAAVDATAQNLKLNLMVTAGQYAGGGVYFDSCVDARSFNSVQFTASIMAGSLNGCAWQVQLQTQDQRASTLTNPSGGTCNATTTTCERYPAATLAAATATATTFTTRFTAFNNPATSAIPTASQVVGLQWQVNSGNNGTGACTVELRIDNVKFVTQ